MRVISIAAFALLLSVPVWGQRGGHGGGHVSGSVMRGGANFAGGHSFGGMHSRGVRSGPGFSRSFNHSSGRAFTSFNRGFTRRDRGFHGHRNREFRDFRFGNSLAGWGWGWSNPWWGASYYDPWVWSTWEDEDRRFDEAYYRQYEMADRWNQRSLAEQQMRRQQEDEDEEDAYASRSSRRRSISDNLSQPPDPVATTVLVYRDQRRLEVQNYAIVGQTLWAFSAGQTQKVPLADLDVAATEKANDDHGVTFRAPAVNQGQ